MFRSLTRVVVKRRASSRFYSTNPMPCRPGYGLGSWIPPEVVKGMKEEANFRSKIVVYDQINGDLESTARELLLEKNQVENQQNSDQTLALTDDQKKTLGENIKFINDSRINLLVKKLGVYKNLFDTQIKQMDADDGTGFSTFTAGVESPVDWTKSKVDYVDRSFDSISVNAHFFNKEDSAQGAGSHSSNVTASATAGVSGLFGTSFKAAVSSAVHNAVTATQELHDVESTLLVTSFATHRKVKQFNPLVLDPDNILEAWNFYFKDQQIDLQKLTDKDMEGKDDQELGLLNEVFLGSCMIGMVHFIKSEKSSTSQSSQAASAAAEAEVKKTALLASITGATSVASQFASKMAQSQSSSGLDVKMDLICLGYLPTIKANTIKTCISQFADFDPAKFDVQKDAGLFPELSGPQNQLISDNKAATQKQESAGAVIQSTIMGVVKSEQSYNILDYQTFLNAFDDYVNNAPKIDGVGVPIGMGLKYFNKGDVVTELAKKYFAGSSANYDAAKDPNAAPKKE